MIQPFHIEVDFKQKKQIREPIVTQLDDLIFTVSVFDNGRPVELNGSYKMVTKRPDSKSFFVEGVKTGENEITFDLGKAEVEKTGKVLAAIQLFDTNNQRISSFPFSFNVVEDLSLAQQPTSQERTLLEIVIQEGPSIVELIKEK